MKRILAFFLCLVFTFALPFTAGGETMQQEKITTQGNAPALTQTVARQSQGQVQEIVLEQPMLEEASQTIVSHKAQNTATGVFRVERVIAKAGETVSVGVLLENNPGIVSAKVSLAFDSTLLHPLSVEAGDFENTTFGPLDGSAVIINFMNSLQPNNTTNGVLATVTFEIDEKATAGEYPLTLTYDQNDVFDYDFNNVAFTVENGLVTVPDYLPGDVNGDGELNNKDLSELLRYLNGWEVSLTEKAADVNGDGELNNLDYVLLQRYLNGWDVSLEYGTYEPEPEPQPEPITSLRVGTYNIHYLKNAQGNADAVAAFIAQNNLDVVGLQEVDKNVGRDGPVQDQAKVLAEKLGWYYGYSKAISLNGGEYGNALLSKYPIDSYKTIALTSTGEEQRVMGHGVINLNGQLLDVLTVHVCFYSMNATQITQIKNYVSGLDSYVLVGDFSTSDFVKLSQIGGTMVNNRQTTFNTSLEDGAVDNIFVKGYGVSTGVMVESTTSDHHLLYADLDLRGEVTVVNGLRVGTYNIRHLADVGGNAATLAGFIAQNNLDIVGLQEVDKNVGRDGPSQDQVKAIAEALGWYYGYSKAISLSGGEYGHGLISKYPIEAYVTRSLTSTGEEQRVMAHAVINVMGEKINLVNLHLSWQSMTGTQVNEVAAYLKSFDKYIVVGDFNAEYDELTPIVGTKVNNATDRFVTNVEDGAIDNIIVNGYAVSKGTMVESNYSDHSLLYATVTLQ